MIELDCLGDMCPIPAMRLQKALEENKAGQPILLITDHSCVMTSIQSICKKHKLLCTSEEVINGVWEITISPKPKN
ncbi:MAG: sulfurtransferase TusA family protein [Oscillospiraceae bacterium]